MNKIGHSITQKELDTIMKEHDIEKNGVISYNEFKVIFMDIKNWTDFFGKNKLFLKNIF